MSRLSSAGTTSSSSPMIRNEAGGTTISPSMTTAQSSSPLDPLRRGNAVLELGGAGALCIGSDLLISLYVTGPPRIADFASPSTAMLLANLILGGLACIPSWVGAMILLCEGEQPPDQPPLHGRLLRICALLALLFATLYGFSSIALFVILQAKDSFLAFCLQNLGTTDETACNDRWNREWLILVVAAIVMIYHVGMGFPVYHYARGTQYGPQAEVGYLFEMGVDGGRNDVSDESAEEDSDVAPARRRQSRRKESQARYASLGRGSSRPSSREERDEDDAFAMDRPRKHRRGREGSDSDDSP